MECAGEHPRQPVLPLHERRQCVRSPQGPSGGWSSSCGRLVHSVRFVVPRQRRTSHRTLVLRLVRPGQCFLHEVGFCSTDHLRQVEKIVVA